VVVKGQTPCRIVKVMPHKTGGKKDAKKEGYENGHPFS
jgi:hypothetical protein